MMPTEEECVCCHEIPQAYCKIEDNKQCIMEMDDIRPVCIRREVLRTVLLGKTETRGDDFEQDPFQTG